jgi:hypothetical protein
MTDSLRTPQRQQGYYVKIDRGQWVKDGESPTRTFPSSGFTYSGALTKEQHDGLDKLIRDYLDGTLTASEKAPQREHLDRSEAVNLASNLRGTDNIEDITRRGIMVLVGGVLQMDSELRRLYEARDQTPSETKVEVTNAMLYAAQDECNKPPYIRDLGPLTLKRIIRAALEAM